MQFKDYGLTDEDLKSDSTNLSNETTSTSSQQTALVNPNEIVSKTVDRFPFNPFREAFNNNSCDSNDDKQLGEPTSKEDQCISEFHRSAKKEESRNVFNLFAKAPTADTSFRRDSSNESPTKSMSAMNLADDEKSILKLNEFKTKKHTESKKNDQSTSNQLVSCQATSNKLASNQSISNQSNDIQTLKIRSSFESTTSNSVAQTMDCFYYINSNQILIHSLIKEHGTSNYSLLIEKLINELPKLRTEYYQSNEERISFLRIYHDSICFFTTFSKHPRISNAVEECSKKMFDVFLKSLI